MRQWYWNRLRAMTWAERRYRFRQALKQRSQRRRFADGGALAVAGPPPPPESFLAGWRDAPWILQPDRLAAQVADWPSPWKARTLTEAEELLTGTMRWLDASHHVGERPRWRREAVSDVEFPDEYWLRLRAIHPEGAYDMKHLWEMNLHGCLVTLAKAFLLTGDARFSERLLAWWDDWMTQNPPLKGPGVLAPVETGMRLLSWAAALRFLAAAGPVDDAFLLRVWESIHFQRFSVADNLSAHSSANNHLLGELVCLHLIDAAFPGIAEGNSDWEGAIRAEVLRQFAPDGGNREQALHYHAFSLSFALLSRQQSGLQRSPWASEEDERLRLAAVFLGAALDTRGQPFTYGDDDQSEVLPLAEGQRSLYHPVLDHASRVLAAPELGPAEPAERTVWLLGPGATTRTRHLGAATTAVFPRSGHAFLRRGRLEAHLNGGPTGYLDIAAHAHADSLALQIRFDGLPLVVDPGTYSYRGGGAWREALVAPQAHATVSLTEGARPVRLGPFLWLDHMPRALVDAANGPDPQAEGEVHLDRENHVLFRRSVRLVADDEILVEDTVESRRAAPIQVSWPLAPGEAEWSEGRLRFRSPGVGMEMVIRGLPGEPSLKRGDPDTPGTPCVSPGYDRLESAWALRWQGAIEGSRTWTTRIRVWSDGAESSDAKDGPESGR